MRILRSVCLAAIAVLAAASASAQNKAVMEAIPASSNTVTVATTPVVLMVGTSSYPGTLPPGSLYVKNRVVALEYYGDISHATGAPAPSGAAGGALAGSFPNPSLGSRVVYSTNVALATLTDANMAAGTFGSVRIPPANMNAGSLSEAVGVSTANIVPGLNGASELLQLTGAGALPALSGANLTSLSPGNVATGAFPADVIASSVAVRKVSDAQLVPGTYAAISVLSGIEAITHAFTVTSSETNTSAGGILTTSSMTASAFFGDGSHLANISVSIPGVTTGRTLLDSASGASIDWDNRTLTDSSGATSLLYEQRNLMDASGNVRVDWSPTDYVDIPTGIHSTSSVTASAFFGDGSHLSGVSPSKSGFLSANNGTLGVGNFSFGYTSTAVTISSMSVIVTVQGSGGTSGTAWSCCYGGSCVTATSSAGAAVGSSYTGHGAVSVPAGGQIVLEMESTDESVTPTVNAVCGYQ